MNICMKKTQSYSNILIVDDNPKNLQVLGKALQQENFKIEFATDGSSALEWLKDEKFDLILLDIIMPGMDGFEVCRKIRTEPDLDNMPIIFLTAESDRDSRLKGFEVGAQDYITKPFDRRELIMRVKTHLLLKKSHEKLEKFNNLLEEKVLERTRQLNEAKEKAEASDRLKTAFLNNITHEIRTPLSGILGFGQLIIDPDLSMDKKSIYLKALNMSGDRLLETITNYMDISLLVSGSQTTKSLEFNPYDLMNSLYQSFSPECEAKGIEMTLNKSETDGLLLNSDRSLLRKAISHTIRNSVKFTEKGGITIGYRQEKDSIIFYIEDTGIGINKEAESRVLDLFMQADNSNNRAYQGSGLGLSIAKGYIELLGGEINFESEIDKGTIFNLSIPLIAPETVDKRKKQ